jgi:hypothetical protein
MTSKTNRPNDPDPLFEVRTNYLLGHYQAAINAALTLQSKNQSIEISLARDVYVYRCYLEQANYNLVLEEIPETSTSKPLQVIRLLAHYQSNDKRQSGVEANQSLIEKLEQILNTNSSCKEEDMWAHYLTATLYYRMHVYDRTLRHLFVILQSDESFLEAYISLPFLLRNELMILPSPSSSFSFERTHNVLYVSLFVDLIPLGEH